MVLGPALTGACRRPPAHAAAPPAASEPAPSADASTVVAEVAGERITLGLVDERAKGQLESLRHQQYEVRRQALNDLVNERLLEKAAAKRGLSQEALIKAEVDEKITPPSEKDVKELFERYRSRNGELAFDVVRPQIESSLLQQRRNERDAAFREGLRDKGEVRVLLAEPRTTVVIPADAPSLGPASAAVTIVEFLDYQCPYCHRAQEAVDEVLKRYKGKVRFVHRDFILGKPRSMPAARAARCAGEQNRFWEYHRDLLVTDGDLSDPDLEKRASSFRLDVPRFKTCLASDRYDAAIQQAARYGVELGINGTPTFFVNGRRLVGARSLQDFREIIDAELAGAS